MKLMQEQKDFIRLNYPLYGKIYCADKLNLESVTVRGFCEKNLIKVNKNTRSKLISEAKKKIIRTYKVSPDQFLNIQTAEVAYILGLLWADGYIRLDVIQIEALKADLDLIYPIFLKSGKWFSSERHRENRQPQKTIGTNGKVLANFLKENDYTSKSTASACKILSKIPEHLKHYWFLGLVDGDGCFYFNEKNNIAQFSIASSYGQDWTYIANYLVSLGIRYSITRRAQLQREKINHSSVIRVTDRDEIKLLGAILYKNYTTDFIGLKRKYEKFKIIEKMSNERKRIKLFRDDPQNRSNDILNDPLLVLS